MKTYFNMIIQNGYPKCGKKWSYMRMKTYFNMIMRQNGYPKSGNKMELEKNKS